MDKYNHNCAIKIQMREGCFSDKQFKDRRWVKLGDTAKHN